MPTIRSVFGDPRKRVRFANFVLLLPASLVLYSIAFWLDVVGEEISVYLALIVLIPLPLFYWHRYRIAGLAPHLLVAGFAAILIGGVVQPWEWWCAGLAGGLVAASGTAMFWSLARTPILCRPTWFEIGCLIALWPISHVVSSISAANSAGTIADAELYRYAVPAAIVFGAVAATSAWLLLFRPAFELACEPILWLMYRIRGVGSGLTQFPMRGPCLVVANHACWFDPLFLAKVLPRPITPMMTSRFYDLPVARWLLKHVFHAIRVPEQALKQDVPAEIQEAIAALDRGECVVIFPEGLMRRSEEKPLKRFGRGVWQILRACPATPVFACWIEGGWGSYCSYFNGKPTTRKRPDFRRRIGVAVAEAIALNDEILSNHLTTRIELMNRVIESRKLLGLPDLPAFELPKVAI